MRSVNVLSTHLGTANAQEHGTCLDDDQLQALLACFRQQLTLIQGPPGTGVILMTPVTQSGGLLFNITTSLALVEQHLADLRNWRTPIAAAAGPEVQLQELARALPFPRLLLSAQAVELCTDDLRAETLV